MHIVFASLFALAIAEPAAADTPRSSNPSQTGSTVALEDEPQGDRPSGHPAVDSNPHAHAAESGAMPGIFQPPQDIEEEDKTLGPGTIVVDLHDADDKPVPRETVTLGILINSIAKGDSRKHLQETTDDHGRAVFSGLETTSNIAYRVSVGYEGGSFAASPFQMSQVSRAMHVVLHVYPVRRDIRDTLVVSETTVAAEVKDDRIQVEENLTIYNLGRTAWQPDDVRMALAPGYTAFTSPASMSDQGTDEIDGSAKLRGTFAPGQHSVQIRYQLPWSGEKDFDFDVALPPHAAISRVVMPAVAGVKIVAAGFPAAELRRNNQGQSFFVTERRARPDDSKMATISIGLRDLPTPGPGARIATALAAIGVAIGLAFALVKRGAPQDGSAIARQSLLDDLGALERAHASGEVGPNTYERARRELLDSIALTLVTT
ncbi:MAG: hypothetical protein ABSC94_21385 [Polyangiaceae bacterium]|jgi:hypothetical protein